MVAMVSDNWRASEASETLSGVFNREIGDVSLFIYMFGRTYVILNFDPSRFCVRYVVDPVPKLN